MYTVKEVAELLHINPHTVRYYTNMGLLPNMNREKNGTRLFTDEDVECLKNIIYLRECGMSIASIREYLELSKRGAETIPQQLQLILEQKEKVDKEVKRLLECQQHMEKKVETYSDYLKNHDS